jgi:hypothetical protein
MRSSNQWRQMRFNHLRRRELIILLGGAVGAWPFAAIAQSPAKVYRIGLLSTGAALADTSPQGAPLIRGGYGPGPYVEPRYGYGYGSGAYVAPRYVELAVLR